MIHSSPSRVADVFRLARSEPELGSENPWHQVMEPLRMPGMNSFFCSSVPHWRIVGRPTCHQRSPRASARWLWRTLHSARPDPSGSSPCRRTHGPARADPPSGKELCRPCFVELLALVFGPWRSPVRTSPEGGSLLATRESPYERVGFRGICQVHNSKRSQSITAAFPSFVPFRELEENRRPPIRKVDPWLAPSPKPSPPPRLPGPAPVRSPCPSTFPLARPSQASNRVAFLVYRGNPTCGGQGVYTRHLTRELVALGHSG